MEWLTQLATGGLHTIASFIVIISIIVFIHEYGHYWVAKKSGVKIDAFSIGFGPELFGWNDKSGTRWKVSAFPLGGYVKMYGDATAASTPDTEKMQEMSVEEKSVSFQHKSLGIKSAVVAAGPLANFIFAIIVLTGFLLVYGKPHTLPEVGGIVAGSAAEQAGLQEKDLLLTLNGRKLTTFEDIRRIATMHPGQEMEVSYKRGDETLKGTITPRLSETKDMFGNTVKVGLLGIQSGTIGYVDVGPFQAFTGAFVETYNICAMTLKAVGQMIVGTRSTDELSGILRIAKFSGQSTEHGLATTIWFMAMLSINLGLINLFPIPLLDGGHLVFYAVEAVKGRPLAEKVQEFSFKIGFALLITLMLFATFNDLKYFNIF